MSFRSSRRGTRGIDSPSTAHPDRHGSPSRRPLDAVLWLAAGGLLAAVLTWPVGRDLSMRVPKDLGDPLAQAWSVAWVGHAVRAQPGRVFDANVGWPAGPSLAFTDSLLGYLPVSLMGTGPTAAVVRYNLLFLFAYALSFAAAAMLARELGCSVVAATVAGAAFAYAPSRLGQLSHLNVLSTGGVPLALLLFLRAYRGRQPKMMLAAWAVAAWQVSLGFALGIWFCYLLLGLAAVGGVHWIRSGRAPFERRFVMSAVVGGVGFLIVVLALVQPYLSIIRNDPRAARSANEVAAFSPPPRGFVTVAEDGRAWARLTSENREQLRWAPEMAVFPGVTAVLLALLALAARTGRWRMRAGIGAAVLGTAVVSMGFGFFEGVVYRPLYEHLPGWSGLRTPGRLSFVWTLGLALLAAFGAQRVFDRIARSPGAKNGARSAGRIWGGRALVVLLAAAVLWEGAPAVPTVAVPPVPAGLVGLPEPQVHLPSDSFLDSRYMLWSTADYRKIGNDNAGYIPTPLRQIRALRTFPDAASVRFLRTMGYRTVVLHLDLAGGTSWAGAGVKPIAGLGIRRRRVDSLVVFDLGP